MKFVVLGTSEFTLACIRGLLDCDATVSTCITLPREQLPNNSIDLGAAADSLGIQHDEVGDINSDQSIEIITSHEPDFIYSSWPRMLNPTVLDLPTHCCIGTHPTDLPHNRGRHPLHWLTALGIAETKLSFFCMDAGVDTGNVLLQVPFALGESIVTAVHAMNGAAYEGTKLLHARLLDEPGWKGVSQAHDEANYWRKRSIHDVTLDPRLSADHVLRTVRSFSPPYPCARLIFREQVFMIRDAAMVDMGLSEEALRRVEPGRILSAEGHRLKLKVDDAIVELIATEPLPPAICKASYIHPPTRYVASWSAELRLRWL